MKKPSASVLLIEDDPDQALIVAGFLSRLGFVVTSCADAEQAITRLEEERPEIVLSDINLPAMSGIELLSTIRPRYPDVAMVMMTAFSSIDQAVSCIRLGADDYVTKPLHLGDLQGRIERALESRATKTRLQQLESQVRDRHRFDRIIGQSSAMQRVFHIIERAAPTQATVLISGRTGTGKELVARALHYHSRRAGKPFVDINCGALPEHLVASELFGHQKGAFTGATEMKKGLLETAEGGTLFLDEVQSLKPDLQTMLLRALQERTIRRVGGRENIDVDVRIVAATNKDITEAVRRGEFREDLYYRLNVVTVYLPELRERKEDIPLLLESFLKELAPDGAPCHFSTDALRTLQNYSWPGNVRELRNAVECALTIGRPPTLSIEDLPPHVTGLTKVSGAERTGGPRTLDDVERVHILRVLDELHQNHTRAAEVLGIDRRTLYRKLDKYKIEYSE
jgi:DNA-binding NtrC family response regulator